MLKVIWFLRRAPHLTLAEFAEWWEEHLALVADRQQPQLLRYVVNIRTSDDDRLAGRPPDETDWDGVAEQWFADEASFDAVYGRAAASETRDDTTAHVSALARLVVREIPVLPAGPDADGE